MSLFLSLLHCLLSLFHHLSTAQRCCDKKYIKLFKLHFAGELSVLFLHFFLCWHNGFDHRRIETKRKSRLHEKANALNEITFFQSPNLIQFVQTLLRCYIGFSIHLRGVLQKLEPCQYHSASKAIVLCEHDFKAKKPQQNLKRNNYFR